MGLSQWLREVLRLQQQQQPPATQNQPTYPNAAGAVQPQAHYGAGATYPQAHPQNGGVPLPQAQNQALSYPQAPLGAQQYYQGGYPPAEYQQGVYHPGAYPHGVYPPGSYQAGSGYPSATGVGQPLPAQPYAPYANPGIAQPQGYYGYEPAPGQPYPPYNAASTPGQAPHGAQPQTPMPQQASQFQAPGANMAVGNPPQNSGQVPNTPNSAVAPQQPTSAASAETGTDESSIVDFMPNFQGRPIYDWIDEVNRYKREGNLDEAFQIAQGCMEAMVAAARQNPTHAMEFYVTQVVIIQHKQKDFTGEIATIEAWLALNIAPPRQDYRIGLLKRLAKARESLARQQGEDPTPHTVEWKRYLEMEKAYKANQQSGGGAAQSNAGVSTGKSAYSRKTKRSRSSKAKYDRWIAPLDILECEDFVAVDFETANKDAESACQIALVKFSDGRAVEAASSLLKPPEGFDEFIFTYLHGISADDVQQAPTWEDIAPEVANFCGDLPVYAHNAAFDSRVWSRLDDYYETDTLPFEFYCSYRTAQKMLPGLENYKLPTVVKALLPGYELQHHQADSDALACGNIIAALQKMLPSS